jgi:hypothetical protein
MSGKSEDPPTEATRLECLRTTPFGFPVLPHVYIIKATSSVYTSIKTISGPRTSGCLELAQELFFQPWWVPVTQPGSQRVESPPTCIRLPTQPDSICLPSPTYSRLSIQLILGWSWLLETGDVAIWARVRRRRFQHKYWAVCWH